MIIGVTGHQARPSIDWPWASTAVRNQLLECGSVQQLLTCLAAGSDQLFATIAIELGISVTAVIPCDSYEKYFEEDGLREYQRLLTQCDVKKLNITGEAEEAFFEAGKFIVRQCDILIAIWDGAASEGLGGTADVVGYAKVLGRKITHINPVIRKILIA